MVIGRFQTLRQNGETQESNHGCMHLESPQNHDGDDKSALIRTKSLTGLQFADDKYSSLMVTLTNFHRQPVGSGKRLNVRLGRTGGPGA